MELLIPGLILVALMVYASTKIKKNAALAYEREKIETPEFLIVKPDGFICPVDHSEELLFAAYSKEYGREQAESVRQASAEIKAFAGHDFEEVCERARNGSARVISEDFGTLSGAKCCILEAEQVDNGITFDVLHKIMAGDGKVYELTVSVLPEHKDDYSRKIDELAGSFTLK